MPVYDPKDRIVEVRCNPMKGNTLLFMFNPSKMEIELKHKGVIHVVKLHDLLAFADTSHRAVFRAEATIEDKDDNFQGNI